MAGYTINDLKKAGSLSGQDAIPVQQNGITRQFEVGIMDNASLVKQSGSQSSGVIRKAQTFVLQSATKINFTLENAVGRIVTDNEYVDNAEAASGWKVYVVNISSIEHTVIHGANSWPVPAGEILCFYWTGSRFTLHNIVINNITVRGDTKLLNISAVQALAAANKIPVIGTDGKLASTTAQAIVDLANVDGKINNAVIDLAKNFKNTDDMNKAKCDIGKVAFFYVASGSANCPPLPSGIAAGWNVHVMNNSSNAYRLVQIAYSTNSNYPATFTRLTNDGNVWSDWVKLTTETDVNNALANQSKLKLVSKTDANECYSETDEISYFYCSGTNCPNNDDGFIQTIRKDFSSGNKYVRQIWYNDNTSIQYTRYGKINGSVWGTWEKLTTESDVNNALTDYQKATLSITKETDADTLKDIGIYHFTGVKITNIPTEATAGNVSHGFIEVNSYGGANKEQFLRTYNAGKAYVAFRRFNSSTWGDWEKLTKETDVNNALANYQRIKKISLSANQTLTLTHNNSAFAIKITFQGGNGYRYGCLQYQGYGNGTYDHIFELLKGSSFEYTKDGQTLTIPSPINANIVIEYLIGDETSIVATIS